MSQSNVVLCLKLDGARVLLAGGSNVSEPMDGVIRAANDNRSTVRVVKDARLVAAFGDMSDRLTLNLREGPWFMHPR
jgi:hypothetical protein